MSNKSGQTPAGLARMIGNYDVAQRFEDVRIRGIAGIWSAMDPRLLGTVRRLKR